ncbi:MAG: hypothetical protein NZ529_04425 [Cytophagaceae bacterium]|nr:hypothetical protein [Cytophagaceae bacterium]MDW8456020.1 hypothetical protein [Cytophagaceae bacterium]
MITQTPGIGSRVQHTRFGEGIIAGSRMQYYKISFFNKGIVEVPKDSEELELLELIAPEEQTVLVDDLETTLIGILRKWSDISEVVHIADKWRGGTLVLKPKDNAASVKEIPMDTFFHKIVMLRDRLRVLEQKINAHPKLDDAEKVEMQQYITRIYGTLTTFNVLFKNSSQVFVGEKSK